MLCHLNPCLVDTLRHGLAATEKKHGKKKIPSKQKLNGAPHSMDRQSLIAALRVAQTVSAAQRPEFKE
jgi:hypothetical protein